MFPERIRFVLATMGIALLVGGALAATYGAEPPANKVEVPSSEFRTWTDNTGTSTVEAAFVELKDGSVRLRKRDGRVGIVPLARLSKQDQEVAKALGELSQKQPRPDSAAKPEPPAGGKPPATLEQLRKRVAVFGHAAGSPKAYVDRVGSIQKDHINAWQAAIARVLPDDAPDRDELLLKFPQKAAFLFEGTKFRDAVHARSLARLKTIRRRCSRSGSKRWKASASTRTRYLAGSSP